MGRMKKMNVRGRRAKAKGLRHENGIGADRHGLVLGVVGEQPFVKECLSA